MSDSELVAIDGRLNALVQQRDNAMNQFVMLSGEYAKLKKELEDLKDSSEGKPDVVPSE